MPTVAVHECGHVLGFIDLHTVGNPTVMEQYSYVKNEALKQWDGEAVRALYANDVCTTTTGATWGQIKAMYAGYTFFDDTAALSGTANTIVWNHLPNPADRAYFVYRSEDDDEEVQLMGTVLGGDSVFVDTTTAFGKRYTYHIACAEDSTLLEVGSPTAGLKLVHDHLITDGPGEQVALGSSALAVRNGLLFAGFLHQVRSFDVSDPSSPVELGRRSGLDLIWNIALSEDGDELYVQTYSGFLVLDATQSNLPVLDEIADMVSGEGATGDTMEDMAVVGDVVYLACGVRGLKAIAVDIPSSPARQSDRRRRHPHDARRPRQADPAGGFLER
jgi:hypothetical protein